MDLCPSRRVSVAAPTRTQNEATPGRQSGLCIHSRVLSEAQRIDRQVRRSHREDLHSDRSWPSSPKREPLSMIRVWLSISIVDSKLNRNGSRGRHRAAKIAADSRLWVQVTASAAGHEKGTRPTKNALHASGFA